MENLKNDCFLENNIDSFDTIYYPLASEVARGYSNATFLPSVRHNPWSKVKGQGHGQIFTA
jgi:hypothetical protein